MITIGDRKLPTSTPADLDAKLVEATGCSAAETRTMLAGEPLAPHLAKALMPFMAADAPPEQEIAAAVAALDPDDLLPLRKQVVALYDRAPAAKADA